MRPNIDDIRVEAHILFRDITKKLPGVKVRNLAKFCRGQTHYGQWNWMVEAAVCEVMREISNLQTDIEDFAPTTQPIRNANKQEAA